MVMMMMMIMIIVMVVTMMMTTTTMISIRMTQYGVSKKWTNIAIGDLMVVWSWWSWSPARRTHLCDLMLNKKLQSKQAKKAECIAIFNGKITIFNGKINYIAHLKAF